MLKNEIWKGTKAILDQSIVSTTSFVSQIIIARNLSKETYGLFILAFTVVTFAIGLQTSIISLPYTIDYPKLSAKAKREFSGSTLIHQVGLTFLLIICLLLAKLCLDKKFVNSQVRIIIPILIPVIGLILLREYVRRFNFASFNLKGALFLDILVAIFQISGLLILAYVDKLSLSNAYWIIGIANGVCSIFWLFRTRNKFYVKFYRIIKDFRQNLSFGKWIYLSGLVWLLNMQIYPWIIVLFHGTEKVAVYGVCWAFIGFSRPVVQGIGNYIEPTLAHAYSHDSLEGLKDSTKKTALILIGLLALFVIVVIFIGNLAVEKIYGKNYADNGIIILFLALDALVSGTSNPFSRALFTIKKSKLEFGYNFLSLIFTLTIGILLVKTYGPFGAALGIFLSNLIGLIMKTIAFDQIVKKESVMIASNGCRRCDL